MLEKYEKSASVRTLFHLILFVAFLFAVAALLQGIGSIKWW